MESLIAAVQNGANAVYLGGKLFNARKNASNFDDEEMMDVVSYAHLRGVRVYVTVNILLDDGEIEKAIDYVRFLYSIDVDALIVQDIGFASLVRQMFPDLDLHASTQMTINNIYGVRYLKDLGFKRVVLARETPLADIKYICENVDIEIESFVHGALCMSYSGQCLMSSLIGGRSGNRGTCAQPCRMMYSIVDKKGTLLNNWDKVHALSPKDLNTLEGFNQLIESGITSFKIEGRMKRPEYVATMVSMYRKVIDKGSTSISDQDQNDILQIFNRGFTKGLGFGDFGKTFISSDRPDNRGTVLGKIINVDKYKIKVLLEQDLYKEDGIEIPLSNGKNIGLKSSVEAKVGDVISLDKMGFVNAGDIINKSSSVDLLFRAKESYIDKDIKIPVEMEITIKKNSYPRLIVKTGDLEVETISSDMAETSNKVALDEERVQSQLSKLGDSIYSLKNIKIDLDDDVFFSISALNKLRRDAIEELNLNISSNYKRKIIGDIDFIELKKKHMHIDKNRSNSNNKFISISVRNIGQLKGLDFSKSDRVYINFTEKLNDAANIVKSHGKEAFYHVKKILEYKDFESLEEVLKNCDRLDGVSVSNLGTVNFIKKRFSNLKIHGDIGLNVFNSYSIKHFKNVGLGSITLSPELNFQQINKLMKTPDMQIEGICFGYLPLMLIKNCPMAIVKNCKDDKNCSTCNYNYGYKLEDRIQKQFLMDRTDGFTIIYNSVPLFVLDNTTKNSILDIIRLDFVGDNTDISSIQQLYYNFINDNIKFDDVRAAIDDFKINNEITKGHYYRGVIQ